MSRQEKIGAFVLGALLFAGLFYFIYTTMNTPLPPDLGGEDYTGETFNEEEALPAPEEETPALSTNTATSPAPAAAQPESQTK
jgi:hypothetical protein